MKLKSLLAALAVAAILPVAAYADEASPSDKANGARACQALKAPSALGEATFKATYGTNADKSNAMGNCVSKWTRAEHQNRHEATASCKAAQADAGFAAAHDGKSFGQFYGTGKNGANALSRCIRAARSAESAADKAAVVNAARSCKGERKSMGDAAFRAKYGTNADKSNAFGKCVSKLATAKPS
jgi:hypothetical protein